jgi:hypothetical protein
MVLPTRCAVALAVALACPAVLARQPGPSNETPEGLAARIDALQRQVAAQAAELAALQRELAAGKAAPAGTLDAVRGTGSPATTSALPASALAVPAALAAGQTKAPASTAAGQASTQSPAATAQPNHQAAASSAARRLPPVAPLFEQPGVLTPKGKLVLEPSMQFGYASSNRVALVGYTIIPALLIGLVDVREVKRNTLTGALAMRYGLSRRIEVEARLPYVYRSDSTVSREVFTGTAVERVFDTSGRSIGDAELALRYQLNEGAPDGAYYVGALRLKTRTGRDPFTVITDCTRRCVGDNATGTGLPLTLPTGSGFTALQPSLTWLFPSDPVVFFGSVSYLHNFKRNNVSRTVLNGEKEFLGDVAPGGVIGFNAGMGLALNDKATLSLGYDHSSIARTRQAGVPVPGAVRTQLGNLLVGFSYRLNDKRSINVAIGAGLTRDTPDVSLTLRLPLSL